MEDVHKVMQQKLGKQLEAMKTDIINQFPDEDPEILLLHWICDKHGIKRPKPKPKSMSDSEPSPPLGWYSEGRNTGSLKTLGSSTDLCLDAHVIAEVQVRTPRSSPRAKIRSDSMLIEKLNSPQDSPSITTNQVAGYCVEDDAWRFEESIHCIQSSQDRLAGTVAKLRTQLRGKFINRIPLFVTSVLSDMDRYWLIGKLRPWNFKAGDVIVKQGDVGDTLYIIERGNCEVIVNDEIVGVIGREDFFGELSVMYASPRSATVKAKSEVTLLSLSRSDLCATISEDKVAELAVVARARLFTGVPLLSSLSPKKKEFVTSFLKMDTWSDGAILATQGHLTDGDTRRMYIVLDGLCRKEVKPSSFRNEPVGVEIMRHGDFFNMFAMWYGCPCSATVTAMGEATTLSLSYDELQDICKREKFFESESSRSPKPKLSRSKSQFVHLDQEESSTLKAIRHAMWIYLLKMLFQKLDMPNIVKNQNALELVCEQSKEISFQTWDPLFSKGTPCDMVYILEVGAISEHESDIETLRDEQERGAGKCIHHTAPGTCFGLACLQGKDKSISTSTATASQESLLLCIPGDTLRRMLRNGSLT